ncbi:MAG: hypothetical protein AB1489_19425 [Acidobacteriota bacterium]
MRAFFSEAVKWYGKNRPLVRALFTYAFSKTHSHQIQTDRPSFRGTLLQLISAVQRTKQLRDDIPALDLAQMLGMLFIQATSAWLQQPKGASLSKKVDQCLKLFLEGATIDHKES